MGIQAKDAYEEALYVAAKKAANLVEQSLDNEGQYPSTEDRRLNIALKLLAIVQSAPTPEAMEKLSNL